MSDNDSSGRMPWGEEQFHNHSYEERIKHKQMEIERGGRGKLSPEKVEGELEKFKEKWTPDSWSERECPACGTAMGDLHEPGCDHGRCPKCGKQLIFCEHWPQFFDTHPLKK